MSSLQEVLIVDLDGTLTNCEHRVHYVECDEPDWKSFYKGMIDDPINEWCKRIIETFSRDNVEIIFITGRPQTYRNLSEEWLRKHQIVYKSLYMRDEEDHRDDHLVKKEIYLNHVKDKFKTLFVLDDRKSVVTMWRGQGLTCLQPDWGEF